MESYLHEIKDIAYFLAAIYCPLTNQELIQYIVDGLDDDYDNFITTATYFRDHFTFDDLRTKLILYEPRVLRNRDDTSSVTTHQALPQIPDPVALLIMPLLLVATLPTIGEALDTIPEVGVTATVVQEAVVVDRVVDEVAIWGIKIILLGNKVHLHKEYLLLIALVLH